MGQVQPALRLASAWRFGVLALALLSLPPALRADEEFGEKPRAVEPIVTEETLPNEIGALTLRIGFDHRGRGGEASGARPAFTLFYGASDRIGASLRLPVSYRGEEGRSFYGLGDVSLGLKYLLVEPGAGAPAIVLGLEAGAPTGDEDRDLGEGAWEIEPFIAVLKDFGPVSIQGNFGWSKQVTRQREERFTYNWALAAPFHERRLHLLLELNGDFGREGQSAIAPGIKWSVGDEAFIALATTIGLNERAPKWGLVAQFQVGIR